MQAIYTRLELGCLLWSDADFNFFPPHSSVSSIANLRTGGHWFDPQLCLYSFRGLMIDIATGFIPLSPMSLVLTMVMSESRQWLGKNIVQSTG